MNIPATAQATPAAQAAQAPIETVPAQAVAQAPIETVPAQAQAQAVAQASIETVAQASIETVAQASIETVAPKKTTRLSKTDKWNEIALFLTDAVKNANQELVALMVKHYKPNSGGGGHLKAYDKRIEDLSGELIAKKDGISGFWFMNEVFSKNKYETKDMYSAINRKKREIEGECRTLLMSGQPLNEGQRVVYDPASTPTEVEKALVVMMGDEVNSIVNNYNTLGMYLGATQSEAIAKFESLGITVNEESKKASLTV